MLQSISLRLLMEAEVEITCNNESINIIADDAPAGYIFEEWLVNSGNPYISNKNAMNTLLRMTTSEAEVSATYKQTLNYLDDCDDDLGWNDANSYT